MHNLGAPRQQLTMSFSYRQWIWIRAEEPISVDAKWASDTFAYQNPSRIPFGNPLGIHAFKTRIFV